jgi:putative toxin-antitoxin system antitoxin component (TIGR02293 family)
LQKVAELKKSTKRARKSLDQGIRDAQYVLKKVRHNKAVTKLTLNETIRKAQRLISNIEAEIKPGQDSANRTLKRHKKRLAALITVQKRCIEVFDNLEKANGWLRSPSIALGWNTPMEKMISNKGIEQVLNELGRIEHGIVS